MLMNRRTILFITLLFALLLAWSTACADPILFLSTQLTPIPEATMMRQVILKDFPQSVDFEPYDDRAVYEARVLHSIASPSGTMVLGGLQEDFLGLYRAGALTSVDSTRSKLADRSFIPRFSGRGVFGADGTYFVPWMHATYLMAANKRALKYLPKGADLEQLSYDELQEWAANMYRAAGKGKLGFPVGPKGLMVRFLQGYLYPSFTGSMTNGFASPAALIMWQYLRDLWEYVDQSSLILNRMDKVLLNGDVWVAWDHSARLLAVFKEQPDEFVAFPAPIGPRGRGVISVLAGLGLPKGFSSAAAEELIEYLTRPAVQAQTMDSVGFQPVVEVSNSAEISKGLAALMQATTKQLSSPEAIFSTMPPQTTEVERSFNLAYMVAFSQIVLRGMSTHMVLETQERYLNQIVSIDRPAVSEITGH
jgi:multiple sugar transport system substrate-binding protein